MPFPYLPALLGICFALLWAFIGGMILRDGQTAARRERDYGAGVVSLSGNNSHAGKPRFGLRRRAFGRRDAKPLAKAS